MSGENDSKLDKFFAALNKGADAVEGAMKNAHHPDKDYDAEDREREHSERSLDRETMRGSRVIDIDVSAGQGVSDEQKLMLLRMQLYAAVQKLKGPSLESFRDLLDEIQLSAEVIHGKRHK